MRTKVSTDKETTATTNIDSARDYELWVLLHQLCHAISRAREAELRTIGITLVQAAVLFIVNTVEGPATPALISRWLFRKSHSVSELLERMEKEGLVKRVKNAGRKHSTRVVLTEKGEQAYQRARAELRSISEVFSCLSEEERSDFETNLKMLRKKALDQIELVKGVPFP